MDSKNVETQLQNKQAEISDLSNMLERSEDSFESILLEMLQKTEETFPKVICQSVLLSLFSRRSVLRETGINRFTKRRIIKEKVKNLKNLVSVLKLLQGGKDLEIEKAVDECNQVLISGVQTILKQSEAFLKETKKESKPEKLYFDFFQSIHDFWKNSDHTHSKQIKQMNSWKKRISK